MTSHSETARGAGQGYGEAGAAVRRPLVRWYGGKWKLAPKLLGFFPAHRVYVEPFGGGGSMLLRKPRSYAEVYNDLDGEAVNLFKVLRNEAQACRLVEQLRLTPFAREEFEQSFEISDEPVERARRLIVLSFMGFGANAHSRYQTGFRSNSNRSGTTPAQDWRNYPDALPFAIDRLRGVVIEATDARKCMARHDGPATLHYVDPPYIMSTRWKGDPSGRERRGYVHELSDDDHVDLLTFLRGLRGMVVLSAYAHPLYERALSGWRRIEIATYADGARPRTEIVWLNPATTAALSDGPLMDHADAQVAAAPSSTADGGRT